MKKCGLLFALSLIISLKAFAFVFSFDAINHWMLFNDRYTFDGAKVNSAMNIGSNNVAAVTEDAAGNIWMAITRTGVRMWDGKKLIDPKLPKDSYALNAEVLSIAADSKGAVWVGTSEGLVKYDGSAWTNIPPEVTGLQAVREIVVTPTDKVYLSGFTSDGRQFTGGGISFYNGQGWTKFNSSNSAIPDTMLQNLVLDGANHLWMTVGNHDLGVAKFDGKNWKLFNSSNGLPTNNIRAIARDKSGVMHFAATKGVLEYDGNAWTMRPYSNSFGKQLMEEMGRNNGELDVTSLMLEDDGTTWIGVRNSGLYSFREAASRTYNTSNSLLPGNTIMQVLADRQGNKWLVTGQQNPEWKKYYFDRDNRRMYNNNNSGVAALKEYGRVTDPKWTVYDDQSFNDKLGTTYSIGEDKEGNIWMANDVSGLIKMKDGKHTLYRYKNAFLTSFSQVHVAQDGKIYVAGLSGIKVLQNDVLEDYAKWPNMGGVLHLTTDAKGTLWSAGSGGLSRYVNGEWETFNKRHGDLPSVIVYTAFTDSKGRLWAGTAKGLARYDDSVFTKIETEFPSDDIQCIAEDSKGRLWAGSNRGVSIYDGTTWTHISKVESPKLNKFRVNSISFDKNDVAWIGTEYDGLLRYDGTAWTQYSKKADASLFKQVYAVKVASDSKVYVSSGVLPLELDDPAFSSDTGDDAILAELIKRIKKSDPKQLITVIAP